MEIIIRIEHNDIPGVTDVNLEVQMLVELNFRYHLHACTTTIVEILAHFLINFGGCILT